MSERKWLQEGDLLRVIAPSGCLREFEAFDKGVEIWRSRGYRVELTPGFDSRWGYLAGTDDTRLRQLTDALKDSECRAILCARGGYGSTRLLEMGRWGAGEQERRGDGEQLPTTNYQLPITNYQLPITNYQLPTTKWLIGFSDITALLWNHAHLGIWGVHGPLLTTLASEPDWSIERLFDLVEGRALKPLQGKGWGGGRATGVLLPANLTVATHLLGTPYQPDLTNVILAFEDVTEAPYRIDRMLTQWRMMGAFSGVRGIALGRFSRCEATPDILSFTVEEVLRDRLADLNIPIVSNLPFGHDGPNAALPVGIPAQLDADSGVLSCG
ncbi:LD-carboxypeptidase [Kamptonema sp. UHCC 0994]|uniref:S66 peptidase family protein n=1 Tax=Kamptonema sp. UHCC 0994 TaxID=3031329 RepID=UPI0023B9D3D6|nr:LD-carboxypeptidase [Kamptonema sp. UHCC 0994]MDF0556048.1 LD-carboxypeptidase [Kamptonema sp. UHCC 0994]